jgi:DNA repair exonuclease SbcCD ATPase subunit
MITRITLKDIASYKKTVSLETDKKVNLIYGLNGTGKSTLSNYLYNHVDESYSQCSIENIDDTYDILVYNQTFIQENFVKHDQLDGIFTLSKENKKAETIISNSKREIEKFQKDQENLELELKEELGNFNNNENKVKNKIWEIKSDYTGGDRVLEYCLEGLKGNKDKLFKHLIDIEKHQVKPDKIVSDLKKDLEAITGENAQKYEELSQIDI